MVSFLRTKIQKVFGYKYHLVAFILFFSLFYLFLLPKRVTTRYEKYLKNINHYRVKEEIVKTLAAYDYNEQYVAVTTSRIYRKGRTVHCHYFDKHRKRIPGTSRQVQFYNSTVVLCPKQNTVHFQFIDLSFSPQDLRRYSQPIPINRSPLEAKTDFAICVKLGVQPNWLEIVKFIEWHKKIGFTFFYLTTLNVDEYTRRIIDDYERLGFIHLTSMKTSQDVSNSTVFENFRVVQERNCELRAKTHSKWYIHLGLNEKITELPKRFLPVDDSLNLVVQTVQPIFLEKYSDEEDIRKIIEASHTASGKPTVSYRKIVKTEKKSSAISPFPQNPSEPHSSSVAFRASYIYKTRPLYCDEIDVEILSWCNVSVYHCQFRNATSEKRIMQKRKEIQKDYKGIVYTW